jgi:SAM-dependent methyltransferase
VAGGPVLKKISDWLTRRVYAGNKYGDFPKYWYDIPQVAEYVNQKITGSREPFFSWLQRKYAQVPFTKGLSVGCGYGNIERELWTNQICREMDCYDISPQAIKQAQEQSLMALGPHTGLRFHVGNILETRPLVAGYDFVLFWASLHHFTNIEGVLKNASQLLRPGGFCFIYEFIGPSKFQWPSNQLALVNAVLNLIPKEWRIISARDWPKLLYGLMTLQFTYSISQRAFIKRKVTRPYKWAMWLRDPSEAVCSADIPAAIHGCDYFDVVEESPFGGSLLHLLLVDIYHNFMPADKRQELLRDLIQLEETLERSHFLPTDFTFYVLKNKSI